MRSIGIRFYVAAILILAVLALIDSQWSHLWELTAPQASGLGALLLLGVLSESSALQMGIESDSGHSSITFLPAFAAIVLYGPTGGMLLLLATGLFADLLIRKKELIRVLFNASQYVVATYVATGIYHTLGGVYVYQPTPNPPLESFWWNIVLFLLFTLVFLIVNHLAVAIAISIYQKRALRLVWTDIVGNSGQGLFNDILISPFALVVSHLFQEVGALGIAISILPLLFIRYSYVANHRLHRAQADLLRVLIKAIETRDPYTSGHSLRVSHLSTRIAKEMGLPRRLRMHTTTAGLLHDIGKIEMAFADLLRKEGALTPGERELIQSHASKGAELLSSLGSFPATIVDAVRHHHESFDGTGYPDGLSGQEIPLIARILRVSDSVDAMMSDRPYRQALSPESVVNELLAHAGIQFDHQIVSIVLRNNIIRKYWEDFPDIPEPLT